MALRVALHALGLLAICVAPICGSAHAEFARTAEVGAPTKPNILYLMADDLRPQLGAYGHSFMKTPNIDQLATQGLRFDFAYTQFAYCAPSRNSFLSGRRPDRTQALNFLTTFRERPGGKEWTAMPQFFKNNGYFTSSAGKIYHDGMDDPPSWSYPSNQTRWVECQAGDHLDTYGNYCGVTNSSALTFTDEDLALEEGLKRLDLAHQSGKPWWVSIGVHRPHAPYRVPPGFYGPDVYPPGPNDVVLPPVHPTPPQGSPFMAGDWLNGDINDPEKGCPTCIVPANRSVEYRRWYYAAVTWADYSLGRALKKLQELGVENKTITIFHSDHGYQLGELNEWSKKTNTELATHVPLIVRVPWKQNAIGTSTKVLAELVDIYPTLADLAGLGAVEAGCQGISLAPAFDNPQNLPASLSAKVAYSQIGRCDCGFNPEFNVSECGGNACCRVPVPQFNYMGYSLRNQDWRFTAWVPFDNATMKANWTLPISKELFNLTGDTGHNFDFDAYSLNLADNPEYSSIVESMLSTLRNAVTNWY